MSRKSSYQRSSYLAMSSPERIINAALINLQYTYERNLIFRELIEDAQIQIPERYLAPMIETGLIDEIAKIIYEIDGIDPDGIARTTTDEQLDINDLCSPVSNTESMLFDDKENKDVSDE